MFKTKEQLKIYNQKYYRDYFKIPENRIKNCHRQKLNYYRKKVIKTFGDTEYFKFTKEDFNKLSIDELKNLLKPCN